MCGIISLSKGEKVDVEGKSIASEYKCSVQFTLNVEDLQDFDSFSDIEDIEKLTKDYIEDLINKRLKYKRIEKENLEKSNSNLEIL